MVFDALTIVVIVVVAGIVGLVGRSRPFAVFGFLVLAIPFRDLGTRWANANTVLSVPQVTAIGRWWFALIAALLILCAARWAVAQRKARRLPQLHPADYALAAVLLWMLIATAISPARGLAFTSLRGYVQPLAVYLIARLVRPSKRELRSLITIWLAVGVVMAAFALVQIATWDEATYRAQGYVRQDGSLVGPYASLGSRRYLRPTSTVSGPNELGVDMLVLAALAAFGALSKIGPKRLINVGLVLLFFGGLAVTVSRSATIGFIAAVAAAAALSREQLFGAARKVDPRALRRTALFALGIVVAATVILAGSGLAGLVIRTLANLPNAYHIVDSVEAIEFLAQQPQGVGMGLVEPKGALSLIEAGGTYHVEGSLFQIAMEMGVWGLAIWLAFWALALARIWRSWPRLQTPELRVLAGAAFAGWIGSLVAFVFLPLMQSISLMVWLWFLLGIGYASESIEKGWSAFSAATGD